MKKFFNFIFIVLGLTLIVFLNDTAAMIKDSPIVHSIDFLPNGCYIETIIDEETFPIFEVFSKEKTKTGTKTSKYKDSSGNVLWSVSVNGTFIYKDGVSSKCTKSSVSTTCPSSNWKIASSSASKSENTAFAKATGKKYKNGSFVFSDTISTSLSCSKSGVLH